MPPVILGRMKDEHPQSCPSGHVAEQLDRLGLEYSIDDDSDYSLTLEPKPDRTQNVFIRSHVAEIQTYRTRDVFSVALEFEGSIPPEMAVALLRYNHSVRCGAWMWHPKPEGKTAVVFSASIPADAPAEPLGSVIKYVALVADDLEEQLYGTDNF